MSKKRFELLTYSKRSFAIFPSDIQDMYEPMKKTIKQLKGAANWYLTHPKTSQRKPGYIFAESHREIVTEFVSELAAQDQGENNTKDLIQGYEDMTVDKTSERIGA